MVMFIPEKKSVSPTQQIQDNEHDLMDPLGIKQTTILMGESQGMGEHVLSLRTPLAGINRHILR